MPPLYLIDGSSYVFRAYYAVDRAFSTSSGFPTNAVFGFSNILRKFIKDFEPQFMGVVFDSKGRTFRKEIYPEYKANRDAPPEDLSPQIEKIMELTEAMGVRMVQKEGFEADDLMATIAVAAEKRGEEVVLVTGDKDFCQLVSEKITIYDPMKESKTRIAGVVEKYGLPPGKFVDFLALVGDSSDNIPGVEGVGPKGAAKLLAEYGSLENLYENTSALKGKQKERIERDREKAFLSRTLATLKTDVETETGREKFAYDGADTEKLNLLHKELEFGGNATEEKNADTAQYELLTESEKIDALFAGIKKTGAVSIDLETTSPNPTEAEIVGIALSTAQGAHCYIPVAHSSGNADADAVFQKIKKIAEDPEIKKIGQNLKYEHIVLARRGIELKGIFFDTMTAAHFLDSSGLSYGLSELARKHLGRKMTTYNEVTTEGKKRIPFADVPLEKARDYACGDSDATMEIYKKLSAEIAGAGIEENYRKWVPEITRVLSAMEQKGVFVDTKMLGEISVDFEKKIDAISSQIYSAAGFELNINSTAQLKDLLFGKLGLAPVKRTAKGAPSTDSEVLKALSGLHPIPAMILEYREISKLKSTYVDALPKLVNPATGRIHTSYGPTGTSTGRLSSSNPNLQNIPIKSEDGRKIRRAFVPADGFVFLSADYSQIELRLLAHFSGDEKLLAAFENGEDIHSSTASEILGVREAEVTSDMRRLAKNINFGIIYGISPFGLSKQLGSSMNQARDYMDTYFSRYPKVKTYMREYADKAKNAGFAETIIGRRRFIPELASRNKLKIRNGERAAINTPIQGSAADIINVAMIKIHGKLEKMESSMILQVHDELILETAFDEREKVAEITRNEMENTPFNLKTQMKVEITEGKNWGELA
ncbi:DNA polymerase I [Candidatus Mycalebacterium sp.]